ncbi:MAG: SRPBCC family protein [Thermomicrobiales bacterium]
MSTTEIRNGGFSVTTEYEASPDWLYRVWTDVSLIQGWLAITAEADARVGGNYVLHWPMEDGEMMAKGTFLELEPGRKIVQSWESWGPTGRFEGMDAEITVEYRDLGNGWTAMTQTETSPAYTDTERIEMSMGGTIDVHAHLKTLAETMIGQS